MSAMSARITAYRSPCLVDSGGESDEEDTSQSLHHQRSEKVSHRDTDSESSDDHLMPKIPKQIEYAFIYYLYFYFVIIIMFVILRPSILSSVRRGRPMPASPVNVIKLSGNSSRTSNRQLHVRGKSEPSKATLSRTDSGRISLRSAKSPATVRRHLRNPFYLLLFKGWCASHMYCIVHEMRGKLMAHLCDHTQLLPNKRNAWQ